MAVIIAFLVLLPPTAPPALSMAGPGPSPLSRAVGPAAAAQNRRDALSLYYRLSYRDCARLLREGRQDDAMRTLVGHEPAWLSNALSEVKAAFKAQDPLFEPLDVQAAMLLHIEVFRAGELLPSVLEAHLAAAWDLAVAWDLAAPAGSRLPRDFVRDCHLVVIWCLQERFAVADLVLQVGLALERFADDGELLLAKGTLWELLAVLPDAALLRFKENLAIYEIAEKTKSDGSGRRLRRDGSRPPVAVIAPAGIYERCAELYQKVLLGTPLLDEARLRLARVLSRVGRFVDAQRVLDGFAERKEAGLAPDLRYLAALFRGRALLGVGKAEAAAESFRLAVHLLPGCQTPQVALSEALRASGDQIGSREVMTSLLEASRHPHCADDPWLRYPEGQSWRLAPLAARLHEEVRR